MSDWRSDAWADLLRRLAHEIGGSELQSLLLEVMRRRASARTPAEVLAQYRRDRFTAPAAVDQRTAVAVDAELLAAAASFTAIELSPLAPLGSCSTVAPTDQHRVVSALRGTEVVADTTNVLALECALRLRAAPGTAVHLTTSQRVVRAQPLPKDKPGFSQHFRLFVLASGGHEAEAHAFTLDTLALHVRTLLAAFTRLEAGGAYSFGARRLDVLATDARAKLGDRLAEALAPDVTVQRKPLAHPYYSGGLRWMLWATTSDGEQVPIGDGGAFDWLAQLLSDRRAVYIASGLGAQLIPLRFSVAPRAPVT
ncbi:MAG TPA: hypothetical protein VG755_13095 [Nannocystaceae bacterium]|nr:hypothetical protein [Nannocystaceae bacterium]